MATLAQFKNINAGGFLALEQQIPGTYALNYPFGEDKLIIRADHTFTQTAVVPAENRTLTISGEWKFKSNTATLFLDHGFILGGIHGNLSPTYFKPKNGGFMLSVEKQIFTGKLFLRISDDWAYRKLDSQTNTPN